MASKIEQIIDEFNEYIDQCRPVMLSKTNISIPRDTLQDFLDQLRLTTPDEIKRYQKIISNRDAIIKDAEVQAEEILKNARAQADQMVTETSVFIDATQKANELMNDSQAKSETMLQNAEAEARQCVAEAREEADRLLYEARRDSDKICTGALSYANEMLGEIESTVGNAYESIFAKSDMLVKSLKANLDIIVANRRELNGEAAPAETLSEDGTVLEDAELADTGATEEDAAEYDENDANASDEENN